MVSGWYGHIIAVYPGNIVQDPTNQFAHTHTFEMCRTGAAFDSGPRTAARCGGVQQSV